MDGFDNIVSVKWLKDHLNHPNVIVINGTIQKVSSNFKSEEQQIENARFFDIKNAFTDTSAEFPNTIPSEIQFQTEAQKLGINKEDFIVVYDEFGIYSSPRVWWLFKTFGHNNVAVLDGGFPEWKAQKFPTEVKTEKQYNSGNFIAKYNPNNIVYFESLEAINKDPNFKIIDARSNDRFMCRVPEPREGLRSGHIPNSVNLPYQNILNEHKFQHKEQIASTFKDLANNNQHLVFTCGSGITASILSLAATLLGYNNSVYDGSWTEYGILTTGNMQDPKQWSKEELLAYILIFVAHSDLEETKKEKEYILSRVDKDIYKRVEEKFNQDNDYQSIQNIIEAVKTHDYYRNDLADLFADIKLMAFADGGFDIMEKEAYHYLKKILK
ncbi:MAG: sulfurtransferase [Mesoflavibacter sp.]|nr:sulfurtransferase [Mesoflavibacter sp.]